MTPYPAQPAGSPPPRLSLCSQVAVLAAEAEQQVRGGLWELAPPETTLARKTAEGLAEQVGPAAEQERLAVIDRLERLREVLAVLAIGTARTHGQLAWFLSRASTVFTPVLHWRALPADPPRSFGTVVPTPEELADAERAVRRLHTTLNRTATAGP
ncbi:hypothetical protein [Streptomyces sp. NRRL S-350]|uniref:hypothetical protein n=1 Tax=Streptomyces sp. NRRL S-350 TaxID=1463902 RepID=UPI001F363F75|nr:hypothetical protein [Streptomyces sp. NRRL S-350]